MRKDLNIPASSGKFAKQAHVGLPKGTYEEELGREGFFGPAAHIYHNNPPTGWTSIEGALRPRAFYLDTFVGTDHDDVLEHLFYNHEVRIGGWHLAKSMEYLQRNADGDVMLFIHKGVGELVCEFGVLSLTEGDYVVLPRGTTYQISVKKPLFMLVVEAIESRLMLPEKGLLGPHAIFDPGVVQVAQIPAKGNKSKPTEKNAWDVYVWLNGEPTVMTYPFDPVDVAGWKGDLFAYKLNWRDIRPLASPRYHLPPSAHTTFVGQGFVVCTFAPRPIESDPDALKVPFFHRNIDFDEVIFYHAGNFFSRDNVRPGMVTWHPRGIHHGPHPKALANQHTRAGQMTDEVAVMVDTRRSLFCASTMPKGAEWVDYVKSWSKK